MNYEEKYKAIIEFMKYYKEAVKNMDISMIDESEKFKNGELSVIEAFEYKIRKLEEG